MAFFLDAAERRDFVRDALKRAGDLERARMRLSLRRGGPRDLAALAACLSVGEAAGGRPLRQRSGGLPEEIAAACAALDLADKPRLAAFARSSARRSPATCRCSPREGGVHCARAYDPSLDEARALRENARGVIARLQADYARETGISGLRIKHNNVLGYLHRGGAKHGDALMKPPLAATFIHRQTMANAVRFSTTELSELEARISRAEGEAVGRETRYLQPLPRRSRCAGCRTSSPSPTLWLASMSPRATPNGRAKPPACVRNSPMEPVFEAEGARHPVVEAALRKSGAGLHRQRLPAGCTWRRRPAPAAHHRPQHGRQVDLPAPERAARHSGAGGMLRAGAQAAARPCRPHLSRASARRTISRAAARPSWSR